MVDTSLIVCLNESGEYIRRSSRQHGVRFGKKLVAQCVVTFFTFYFDRHLGREKLPIRKDAAAEWVSQFI